MEYRGTFEDGVIRPEQPLDLPNGTPVEFHPVGRANGVPQRGVLSEAQRQALNEQFKTGKTVEQLVREQGVKPVRSSQDFAGQWPDNDPADSPDAFIRQLREWRK